MLESREPHSEVFDLFQLQVNKTRDMSEGCSGTEYKMYEKEPTVAESEAVDLLVASRACSIDGEELLRGRSRQELRRESTGAWSRKGASGVWISNKGKVVE